MAFKTVQDWLAAFNVPYNGNDPYAQVYKTIATNETPDKAPQGDAELIEACLRYRGILYFKKTPGDCGTASSGISTAKLESLAGQTITQSGIPIVGSILSLFGSFGAHHAQAVATEQATICQVAANANQGIPQLDAMVRSGQISAQDGIMYMGQAMQKLLEMLATIQKDCNAACVYASVVRAHADFAKIYYPDIGQTTGAGQLSSASSLSSLIPGASSGSLPIWLLLAAAVIILVLIFK
jgi:hypothetical protein